MDAIYAKIAEETIKFDADDDVNWRSRFEPLYAEPPESVHVIRDERYGPDERNFLDVFIPKGKGPERVVLVFVHGGGFFSGDKAWSEKCYGNVGYCFAQQDIITVIANHQLVPKANYPGGADDMQLIREWVHENISKSEYGNGSAQKVVLFGHSSGGAHLCMNLFAAGDSDRPNQDPLWPPVAGLVLWDVPFWFDNRKPMRQKVLDWYYGSMEEATWAPKSALGLFQRLPDDSPVLDSRKLPICLGSVEYEVPETSDATNMFFNAYRARSKPFSTVPAFHILKRHNHLSNILSLGTEDTAQRDRVLDFIRDCLDARRIAKL